MLYEGKGTKINGNEFKTFVNKLNLIQMYEQFSNCWQHFPVAIFHAIMTKDTFCKVMITQDKF